MSMIKKKYVVEVRRFDIPYDKLETYLLGTQQGSSLFLKIMTFILTSTIGAHQKSLRDRKKSLRSSK